MRRRAYGLVAAVLSMALFVTETSVSVYALSTDIVTEEKAETEITETAVDEAADPADTGYEDNSGIPEDAEAPEDLMLLNDKDTEDPDAKQSDVSEVQDDLSEDSLMDGSEDIIYPTGYVMAPYEDAYESPYEDYDGDMLLEDLPQKYVSPVATKKTTRSQGSYGTCWAFATMAAAEMSADKYGVKMRNGSTADESIDLSELHLAYFSGKGLEAYDPLGGFTGDYNGVRPSKNYLSNGGSSDNAVHILSGWTGAADEKDYSYGSASVSYSTAESNAVDDVLHLRNFYTADPITDRLGVKQLIRDYGAVTVSYNALQSGLYYDMNGNEECDEEDVRFQDVYDSTNNCYYMYENFSFNHAVSIIGWDDEFSKDKFVSGHQPEGDGAWLIRNSWMPGVNVYENGNPDISAGKYKSYFWLSYYDKSLSEACYAVEMDPVDRYDHNYQYDGCMTTTWLLGPLKYANIFTASSDEETLKAVFFSTHSANLDYKIDVYTGVSLGSPECGTHVVDSQSGHATFAGGHTIDLSSPVPLEKGEKFSVVITYPNGGYMDAEVSVSPDDGYNTTASTVSGRSLYYDGSTWQDSSEYGGDFRIKAFTCNPTVTLHTITLDSNGGLFGSNKTTETVTIAEGQTYGTLTPPSRAGYDFAGWYTAEGDEVSPYDTVSADITLYAHWTGKSYTLLLDPNGGSIGGSASIQSRQVTFGGKYGAGENLPIPTRDGYSFDGWYTKKTDGKLITDDDTVSSPDFNLEESDHYLYARWTLATLKVTLDANGGNCNKEFINVVYNSKYTDLSTVTATRPGYSLLGWSIQRDSGDLINTKTTVTEISDHTLYARWSGKNYELTLDANEGGFTNSSDAVRSVTFGAKYGGALGTLPVPVRAGYEFDGWHTEKTGGSLITADTDVTEENFDPGAQKHYIYAHWTGLTYTLTLDLNGGTIDGSASPQNKEVTFGRKYGSLPSPEKRGYVFAGWYTAKTGGKKVSEGDLVSTANFSVDAQTHCLYARYTPGTITVTYDANGGTVSEEGKPVTLEAAYGTLAVPVRIGYDFAGWFTAAGGGTEIRKDTIVSLDQFDPASDTYKIYAHWTAKSYTLTLNAGDGVFDNGGSTAEKPVTFDDPYGELPVPQAPEGYVFEGWYLSLAEDGTKVLAETLVETALNHTLYAKYHGIPHFVTFDVNGGDELPEARRKKEVYTESEYGELPEPVREGYDFLGWYPSLTAPGTARIIETTIEKYTVDHTVYAHWKIKTFDVTLDANGGIWDKSGDDNQTIKRTWGSSFTVDDLKNIETPIRGGHRFAGWYADEECNTEYSGTNDIRSDVTIYAGWNPVEAGLTGFVVKAVTSDNSEKDLNEVAYTYTGSAIKPKIAVYDYSVTPDRALVENVDYTVAYKNNINAGDENSEKAPTISITGKGNYKKDTSTPFEFGFKIGKISIGEGGDPAEGFICTIADKQYNGKAQISKPLCKYGKLTLKENKDYTLSFACENSDANGNPVDGLVEVTITAKGNYSGSAKVTYHICTKDESIGTAYVQKIQDVVYTGEVIDLDTLNIVVKEKSANGRDLTCGSSDENSADGDYYLRYAPGSDKTNVGTQTIEIVGKGEFAGTKTATFKIIQREIPKDNIVAAGFTLSVPDVTYTGAALKPQVKVTYKGEDNFLVENVDYTVTYANNTKAAAGDGSKTSPKVTIKGKGNFKGSTESYFTIKPLSLKKSDLDIYIPNIKDNGKAIQASAVKPVVTRYNPVLNKTVTLTKGKDYRTEYTYDPTKQIQTVYFELIGNYMIDPADTDPDTVTIDGKKRIKGGFLAYKDQTDMPVYKADANLDTDEFVITVKDSGLTYTGSAIKPEITVKRKIEGREFTLIRDKDYSVTYANNTKAAEKDSGNKAPSWKITGKGAYKGQTGGFFTILPKELTDEEYLVVIPDMKCTGNVLKPSVKVIEKNTGKVLAASNYAPDGKFVDALTKEPTGYRTLDYTVTGKGETGKGNYSGSLTGHFRVYEEDISKAFFGTIDPKYYIGSPVKPSGDEVQIWADKTKAVKLEEYEKDAETGDETGDYKLSYGENIKPGRAAVIVEGKGKYGGTKTLNFTILPKFMRRSE
ncbi:MAG: InlB B-repeat-containing protein [Lachnospiraceae bacterium]|nr:InlB B-repeat-containing protein [Lachnospiraceae bacterium]